MTHRAIATHQAELGHFTMKSNCFYKVRDGSLFIPIPNDEENTLGRD